MRRYGLIIGIICILGLGACSEKKQDSALLSRSFLESSWERFDFVYNDIEITKPTTYNLSLTAAFDPTYAYDNLMVVFTIFDADGNPFRAKGYKFRIKDAEGNWKSDLVDGQYVFTLPVNSELSINEPGKYRFQIENRMPITPLEGIKEITLNQN